VIVIKGTELRCGIPKLPLLGRELERRSGQDSLCPSGGAKLVVNIDDWAPAGDGGTQDIAPELCSIIRLLPCNSSPDCIFAAARPAPQAPGKSAAA